MTTKARDGDVERSHTHMGRTDVENTDSGCEPRGPGVRGVNTPEQDMFRQKLLGEKMTKDCSRLQLSFQPPRRDVVPSTGNINEPRKVRQTDT